MNQMFDSTWQEFNTRFPTEETCVEELYRRLSGNRRSCPECQSSSLVRQSGDRIGKCSMCKKKVRITARTFFHRVRSVRPWLAAVWLFEHGMIISSHRFAHLVGVAYDTARKIFGKLARVMEDHLPADAIELPGTLFASAICKRSRLTPANERPIAEEELFEKIQTDPANVEGIHKINETEPRGRSEAEQIVLRILSQAPIDIDTLCQRAGQALGDTLSALTMLEIDGVIQRLPYDRYVLPVRNRAPSVELSESSIIEVKSAIEFIRNTFHGVSRKCLQLYLLAYWCLSDRNRWKSGTLLDVCLESAMDAGALSNYVTPRLLKLVLTSTTH